MTWEELETIIGKLTPAQKKRPVKVFEGDNLFTVESFVENPHKHGLKWARRSEAFLDTNYPNKY